MLGIHIRLNEGCRTELDLARDMGFRFVMFWNNVWSAKGYDEVPKDGRVTLAFEQVQLLWRAVSYARLTGFEKIGLKLHCTPGEVGLVGEDRKYSWWEGWFLPKDLDRWIDGYVLSVVCPYWLEAKAQNLDYFILGNELYCLTRSSRWGEWIRILQSEAEARPKIGYASFFTSPVHHFWSPLIRPLTKLLGRRKVLRWFINSFVGKGRFQFSSKEREKEVAEALWQHFNPWRTSLDIVGLNCYLPIWRAEDPAKVYEDFIVRMRPFKLHFNYYDYVRRFADTKPLMITELWFSDTDPDWGAPGQARRLAEIALDFWIKKKGVSVVLWEPPSWWQRYRDVLKPFL